MMQALHDEMQRRDKAGDSYHVESLLAVTGYTWAGPLDVLAHSPSELTLRRANGELFYVNTANLVWVKLV